MIPSGCVLCAMRNAAGWVCTPSEIMPKYTVLSFGIQSEDSNPTKPGSRWWN